MQFKFSVYNEHRFYIFFSTPPSSRLIFPCGILCESRSIHPYARVYIGQTFLFYVAFTFFPSLFPYWLAGQEEEEEAKAFNVGRSRAR